ncbi:ribosomal RNA-processing protein 7-domain-containing protein [Hypoxylon trugodes]|uniref:ribosomal RNA-processing protein 7-domain-containing protein n=1 Tax=Hypoxylon trugodes TaxID=326681 RepID=UPI0021989517|nr:ribosomal RNA-processing protein 7-domain-containing protein [Hypoxylon trugodes]KAI1390079.1 ribosomal RNA-processing protein 7-domain-containing protein [Hypoxylon trugodes]
MPEATSHTEEFSVLPISIPPLPSFPVKAIHYLYIRRNAPKIPTPDDSRSLFIANVPSDSTEFHFRVLIAGLIGAGKFESMTFENEKKPSRSSHEPAQAIRLAAHRKRKRGDDESQREREEIAAELPSMWNRQIYRSGSSGVALLVDDRAVELVLKAVKKLKKPKDYPIWGDGIGDKAEFLGSEWLKEHNKLSYPGNDVIQATMDAYFTVFNRKEREAEQLAKRLRNEPDEDGFVTVTRGGRAAPASRDEAEEAKQKMLERQQKKKDEMTDFYRFQMREKRKAEQIEILKKFEEDKKRVQAMKEKRGKFRPET